MDRPPVLHDRQIVKASLCQVIVLRGSLRHFEQAVEQYRNKHLHYSSDLWDECPFGDDFRGRDQT